MPVFLAPIISNTHFKKERLNRSSICGPKEGRWDIQRDIVQILLKRSPYLSTFTTNTTSKLNIFWHDSNTFGMDGAKVSIFEKTNKISFCSFLKSKDSRRLESKISLEI
uniref:Uncharacterized protein n=1 Tax=Panagrolaimus sp. PS1159 TaxID=55785 RepID=A0AC35GY44_9BILA